MSTYLLIHTVSMKICMPWQSIWDINHLKTYPCNEHIYLIIWSLWKVCHENVFEQRRSVCTDFSSNISYVIPIIYMCHWNHSDRDLCLWKKTLFLGSLERYIKKSREEIRENLLFQVIKDFSIEPIFNY